jgi:hypothetical protein
LTREGVPVDLAQPLSELTLHDEHGDGHLIKEVPS